MELEEALHKAEGFIKEAGKKGYFLCSIFASIKDVEISEWILHFYGGGKALDCYVSDKVVVEESQSLGEPVELDAGKVNISASKALEIAGRRPAITTLLSLHGAPPTWTINFITAAMSVTTFDIDAGTGKITREEMSSILKRD